MKLLALAPLLLTAIVSITLAAGPALSSNAGCADCCIATMEKVTVKKTCFEVECEQICIPTVRIPWPWLAGGHGKGKGDRCEQRCGKVRNVRVLTKRQYEETVCECKWTPVGKGGKWDAEQVLPAEEVEGVQEVEVHHIPTPPTPSGNRYFSHAR